MVTGVFTLSGRIQYRAPVPNLDSSMNPSWPADVFEQMTCSGRKEEEYVLTADGDTVVSFGSLVAGANLIVVKVAPNYGNPPGPGFPTVVPPQPNPVTLKLTGGVGTAAPISVDGFMLLFSQSIAYTAMSLARATGVQTVVRVQLFAFGS